MGVAEEVHPRPLLHPQHARLVEDLTPVDVDPHPGLHPHVQGEEVLVGAECLVVIHQTHPPPVRLGPRLVNIEQLIKLIMTLHRGMSSSDN